MIPSRDQQVTQDPFRETRVGGGLTQYSTVITFSWGRAAAMQPNRVVGGLMLERLPSRSALLAARRVGPSFSSEAPPPGPVQRAPSSRAPSVESLS